MKDSWTKQFTIEMDFQSGRNRMLGLRKHNKIFIENESTEELLSYDLKGGKVEQLMEGIKHDQITIPIPNKLWRQAGKRVKIYRLHEYHAAIPHMDSLVLMEGTNELEK